MTTPEDNAKTEERLKDEYLIAALDYAHDMIDAHKSQPGYFDLKLLRLRALRQIRVIIAGRQKSFEEVEIEIERLKAKQQWIAVYIEGNILSVQPEKSFSTKEEAEQTVIFGPSHRGSCLGVFSFTIPEEVARLQAELEKTRGDRNYFKSYADDLLKERDELKQLAEKVSVLSRYYQNLDSILCNLPEIHDIVTAALEEKQKPNL